MLRPAATVIALTLALGSGCKPREGGCTRFVSEVCRAAGDGSEACSDVKAVTETLSVVACQALGRDVDHALRKLADRRADCDRLASKLCADLGQEACQPAKTQIQSFSAERCTAMLERYPEVAAEWQRMHEGHQAFMAAHRPEALRGVPGFGPADARVTMVEFSDFECDDCARGSPVANHVRNRYGGAVRFVFRQYPLGTHPYARLAAEASLAAEAQGKFWEYHDLLFSNQHDLSRAALERYAKVAGLRLEQFRQALDQHKFSAEVDRDLELGHQVFVAGGVPAMFVNGQRVKFPYDVVALTSMIDDALAAP
jgi:predicted DsbA family dithiol-disulfide isomerase